jgi:hypothetical protein
VLDAQRTTSRDARMKVAIKRALQRSTGRFLITQLEPTLLGEVLVGMALGSEIAGAVFSHVGVAAVQAEMRLVASRISRSPPQSPPRRRRQTNCITVTPNGETGVLWPAKLQEKLIDWGDQCDQVTTRATRRSGRFLRSAVEQWNEEWEDLQDGVVKVLELRHKVTSTTPGMIRARGSQRSRHW